MAMEKRGVIDPAITPHDGRTPNSGKTAQANDAPPSRETLDRIEDDPMTRLSKAAHDEAARRR